MTRSRTPPWLALLGVCLLNPATAGEVRAQRLEGCGVFPLDSIWNARVDSLPLDPASSVYIDTIGSDDGLHPDFGSGDWPPGSGALIGIPFDVVPGDQPRVPVTFLYDEESDPGPYPIPPDASIEGGADGTGDRHVLVLDESSCIAYELFDAWPQASGASWTAASGAVFPLDSYALRPAGWTSADAAGLPLLPGLVRYDEIAAGRIDHALRFTAPRTRRAFVWPARHFASALTDDHYPPMGQRFRLRSDFDLSGFSPRVRVILQALKEYGMMLADNGASWFISGVPDERWNNDELAELHSVAGSEFEAVDVSSLMIDQDSSRIEPPCSAPDRVTEADTTITDSRVLKACNEIILGPNLTVLGPYGEALLSAGRRVVITDNVAVLPDGRLEVATGLPLVSE